MNMDIYEFLHQLDKIEEIDDVDLEPVKDWSDIKVGDKFIIIETNDICTVVAINKNWHSNNHGDCWLIDYKYDNYIEGAPSLGTVKYWPNGDNNYVYTHLKLLN